MLADDRDAPRPRFRDVLTERGIQTTWYPPLSQFTTFQERSPGLTLPRADDAAYRHCALPMSPTLGEEELGEVVAAAAAAVG